MPRFKINYIDPETQEEKETFADFEDTVDVIMGTRTEISAKLWAIDYAYALSDKGTYTITEVKNESSQN